MARQLIAYGIIAIFVIVCVLGYAVQRRRRHGPQFEHFDITRQDES